MICVECGRDAPGLVDGACSTCTVARIDLLAVPPHVDVVLCAHCGARSVGAHWNEPPEGAPESWLREDAVRESVRVHPELEAPMVEVEEVQEDERHFRTTVHVVGTLAAEEAASEAQLLVRQSRSVCDRCSRIAGGYYAAIIQLRATERDVTERELSKAHDILSHELDHAQASGNRFAFLAKSGPQHGGYDYFIGDIDAARNATRVMAHRLGAEVQESAKLVGRRDGRDLYRVTMLVRIRLLAPGDFVLADERPYEVVSVDRGKVTCYDLHRGQRTRIPEKGLRRLGGPEILEEAVVVSHEGDTLQVLDPVTLRTRDVALRGEVIPEGTAMVLRLEEELVLPHAREASIVKYGES